jgi:hypothetical protein
MDNASNYVQVGRNCLADFMGFDPHAAASMAEILASAGEMASACEDEGFMGGGEASHRSIGYYLPFVALSIRTKGWLSKGKAWEQYRDTSASTACDSWSNMLAVEKPTQSNPGVKPEDRDFEVAEKALAYITEKFEGMDEATVTALSDYEHNLKVAFFGGVVEAKTAGIIASGLNFAARDQEKKAEKVDFTNSQFVGEIGKRAIFMGLKCVFPGFGGRPVVFVDGSGNKVSAWNPGFVCEKNGVYAVKATPTKQDEYNGIKSTMLNRMVLATEKDLAPKAPRKARAKKEVVNA